MPAGVPIDGGKLRALRQDRFLTQKELSERARVSRLTIHRLERGLSPPTAPTFRRIAAALGMEPADLMARVRRDPDPD